MVLQQGQFSPSGLGSILSSLDKFFGSMDPAATFNRAAGNNVIVPIAAGFDPAKVSELISMLVRAHPSRIFVMITDPAASQITAEVSAQCQMISKTEHSCSEIIRITANERDQAAMPGLVLANLLTGRPMELFLMDCSMDLSIVKLYAPLVEQIVFSSSDFNEHLRTLSYLSELTVALIDAQWICQAAWHEQIRTAFEHPEVRDSFSMLRYVEICGSRLKKAPLSMSTLLLSGWIISSLKLEVSSVGAEGYDCIGLDGSMKSLKANGHEIELSDRIKNVSFKFLAGEKVSSIELCLSKNSLDGVINVAKPIRFSAGIDHMTSMAAIERYYSIGESIANYSTSLRCALDLENLRLGYF